MNRSRLRSVVVATTGVTYALLLLGIYTAASGAGLTCDARWPLCDGAVFGLFPANWPSFIEWFHRLVAMIGGLMILGSAYGVWRWGAERRVLVAMAIAAILLPVQVWLGAQTVLTYTFVALTAHFVTALVLFSSLVLATIWIVDVDVGLDRVRYALVGALALHPLMVLLAPRVLFVHTARVQLVYYAVGLLVVTALLVATAWVEMLRTRGLQRVGRVGVLAALATILVGGQLVLGRLVYTHEVRLLDTVGAGLTFSLVLVATWWTYRVERTNGPPKTRSGAVTDD